MTNNALGNSLSGSVEGEALRLRSVQGMLGDARATTRLNLTGDTTGYVQSMTQAGGNYLSAGAHDAAIDAEIAQTVGESEIVANTFMTGGEARLLAGAFVGAAAGANTAVLGGTTTSVNGSVDQASAATVRAGNLAETRYVPAQAVFASQAIANTVSANSPTVSNQVLTTRQRSTGALVEADTSANAANAWDITGRADAAANQAAFYNGGGSVVVSTDQANQSYVRSNVIVTSFDFGAAHAQATGAGNRVEAGNDDIYLEIDNTQMNSGGVEVGASFTGTNGYDAYVNADAVGNNVTGYVCSTCPGQLVATNSQTNAGAISAMAQTTVRGSGRAVITGSTAVGNAANFYVARPGD